MSDTPSGYNREYYLKNKDRIAAQKKLRYENDPEYREAVKARRREQKARQRAAKAKARENQLPTNQREARKKRVILPNGERAVARMYTLGQASWRIGITSQTLTKWEQIGVIPEPTYRTPGGLRTYTTDEVSVIRRAYNKHTKLQAEAGERWRLTDEFRADIARGMAKLTQGLASNHPQEEGDDEETSDE